MIAENTTTMRYEGNSLNYSEVCQMERSLKQQEYHGFVHIDLGRVKETSTAALAKLVGWRRKLRMAGGDIRITGLTDRAEGLYKICRLEKILPREITTHC